MKKRLFLLPLIGGLLLSGCSVDDLMFWKKKVSDSDLPANTLKEFGGYKIATSIKEGKRYLLGAYSHRGDLMRFISGDYHRDAAGFYPFYMGTVEATTQGAAEVEVKYTNKSKGEFSLQVFCSDTSLPWHGKYIGVYAAESSYQNKVMSIALLDDPKQKTYIDPKSNKEVGNKTSGIFQFYDKYEDLPAYGVAAPYEYPEVDPEPVPKFLGSAMVTDQDWENGTPDYASISCVRWEDALSANKFDLAHLYEKK